MNTLKRDLISTTAGVLIECLHAGTEHEEAVVFIPGLGANATQFQAQLIEFGQEYHAMALSLRGHGASTCPMKPTEADFTFEQLANDVQYVLQTEGINAAHIVGNSLGGVVGCQLLEQCTQMVRSLTTFGTAGELHSGFMGQVVVWLDRLLGPKGDAWIVERTISESKSVSRQMGAMVKTTARPAIVNIRRQLIDYDYLPTLERHYTTPVLLIRGEKDAGINRVLDSTLETLERRDNSRIMSLEGAGHVANLEQPELFNSILSDFLTSVEESVSIS